MSATITEIAEYNLDNLLQYGLTPIEIISNYLPNADYEYTPGKIDPNVILDLAYNY
jgi:hypothetical protein